MAYVTDLMTRSGGGAAGVGNWIARIGRGIWLAMIATQEKRASVFLEQHRRDGFTW